ncbi:MAG: YhfC family intramembrane metalloprotease [Ruminococcus sp.]|nr:YhfC family intramembrane metalloprotease [Ruminococcus sp.]
MTDLNCLLAGLAKLLTPAALVIFWHKKTGARFYPALIAFLVCLPVFLIAGAIRSGFMRGDPVIFYVQQGLLYGVFEETAKYLVLRYHLTSYDSRIDAVTYGIGHGAFEDYGGGMACLALIGTGRAAPDILWVNLFGVISGTLSTCALTVLIFCGIHTDRSRIMLPIAIFLHAFSNAFTGTFMFSTPIVVVFSTLETAGECYAAYRCWQKLWW